MKQIQPNLLDYSEGRLSGPEADQVGTHLAECAACRTFLGEEAAFAGELAAMPEEGPANDVWALVRARTKPRRVRPLVWLRGLVGTGARRATAAAVAAALALVLIVVVSLNTVQHQPDNSASQGENLVTVKWSDDPLGDNTDAMIDFIDNM